MNTLPAIATPIRVVAQPNALKMELVEASAPAGWTIAEILGPSVSSRVEVWLDGQYVASEDWALTKPEPGALVNIKMLPQGDILRTVLLIAVVVVAAVVAPEIAALLAPEAVASGTALGTGLIAGIGAATIMIGSLLLFALIPPQTPNGGDQDPFQRLASITGLRNRVAAYQPIPRLYGKMKYFPPIPMTGLPYTELLGDDQYLRAMFVLGYGPLDIGGVQVGGGTTLTYPGTPELGANVFIGETSIDTFEEVEIEIGEPKDMTLFTTTILEESLAVGFNSTTQVPKGTSTDNISNIRTTPAEAEEISIDITFPAGLFSFDKKGKTVSCEVTFKVEYRAAGSADPWVAVVVGNEIPWYGGWLAGAPVTLTNTATEWVIRAAAKKTLRRSLRWKVPRGQYDVRVTRLETYNQGETLGSTDADWTAIRAIRPDRPFDVDNVVVMSMRVKATDELSRALDNVAVLATSILPTWNGSTWVDQATRNPAWAYVDILAGNAAKRPVDKDIHIDKAAFLDWANWCDANEFYFDHVYDASGTVFERVKEVGAAARAAWTSRDNKLSIVREEDSQTPVQMFTPRNSSGYGFRKIFPDIPHALRVRFVDPNTYQDSERIVYDDGYNAGNATKFEVLDTRGVTNPDQAWKLGRFHLAQLRLRPEIYTLTAPMEHLIAQRGDAVVLHNDVMLVGISSGRIKSVTRDSVTNEITQFVSDDELVMEPDTNYGIKVRYINGSNQVTLFSTQILEVVPGTTIVTPLTPLPAEVQVGDLFVHGVFGAETIDAKIIRVEPHADLTATLTLVPLAPGILNADTGLIPAWDPVITEPIDLSKLPAPVPVITRIRSDEKVLARDSDGSLHTRMVIDYTFPPGYSKTQIECRYTQADTPRAWSRVKVPSDQGFISLDDVEQGIAYIVQIRSVRGDLEQVSSWTAEQTHTVIGKSSPPADVTNFIITVEEFGLVLSWDEIEDLDKDSYEIRKGTVWEDATFIARTKGTEIRLEVLTSGAHDYLIKAVDTSGNYSTTATAAQQVIAAPDAPILQAGFEGPDVLLTWTAQRGDFPILEHEIRYGGSDWASATYVTHTKSTSYRQKANWSGVRVWRVASIDAAGNIGAPSSANAAVTLSTVTSVNPQVIDNNVLLRWAATPGTIPIDRYEVRRGNVLESAELVGAADTTFAAILESQGGTYTYWIVPIDTAGNEGTAGSAVALVNEPPDFVLRNDFQTDFEGDSKSNLLQQKRLSAVTKHWTRPQTGLLFDGVNDYVEVIHADEINFSGSELTIEFDLYVQSSAAYSGDAFINKDGSYEVGLSADGKIMAAIETDGGSPWSWMIFDTVIPIGVWTFVSLKYDGTNLKLFIDGVLTQTLTHADGGDITEVVTENLHFGCRKPGIGHVPIKLAEIRLWGTNPSDADIAANFNKTLHGNEAGLSAYWRAQITRGNTLPDLTGNDNNGAIVGAVWDRTPAEALIPFPVTETVADKNTIHGYATPQAQIADGYPYVCQPVPTTAQFVEIYDAGVVIPSSRITVSLNKTSVVAGAVYSVTISVKATFGDSWIDFTPGHADVFATNFRYVKVTVDVTAADDKFDKFLDINTQLSTKRKTDEGSVAVTANPTTVLFDVAFIDVDTITATPQGTTPAIVAIDFVDVPNPTGFDIHLFDINGNPITGDVRWIARGV